MAIKVTIDRNGISSVTDPTGIGGLDSGTVNRIGSALGLVNGGVTGDASGSLPATVVTAIQGRAVASTAPTNGQVLQWVSSSNNWAPATSSGGSSSSTVDYGDGADGDATLSGTVTAGGKSYNNLTIASGATVNVIAPLKINGTLTFTDTTSILHNNGGSSATTTGGVKQQSTYWDSRGQGQVTANASDGQTDTTNHGGNTAATYALKVVNGGTGGRGTAGANPNPVNPSTAVPTTEGGTMCRSHGEMMTGGFLSSTLLTISAQNFWTLQKFGISTDGVQGNGDNVNKGGGAGAGGGYMAVAARNISGAGKFQAKGGNGGSPAVGNVGGGGGGAGGIIYVKTDTVSGSLTCTFDVSGGTGGALHGTGLTNGGNGDSGRLILIAN